MESFLEKLKKGMGAELEEPIGSSHASTKASAIEPEQEKPVKKKGGARKLEIKIEKTELEEPKTEGEEKPSFAKASEGKEKWFEQEGQLAVDVYETDGELVIQSAIAGIKPDDLDISIENDRVLIKGERGEQVEKEGKNYFYQECYWGQFSKEVILPVETDPSRAEASMKQGVLTIRLPKIEREKKRKIEVKS